MDVFDAEEHHCFEDELLRLANSPETNQPLSPSGSHCGAAMRSHNDMYNAITHEAACGAMQMPFGHQDNGEMHHRPHPSHQSDETTHTSSSNPEDAPLSFASCYPDTHHGMHTNNRMIYPPPHMDARTALVQPVRRPPSSGRHSLDFGGVPQQMVGASAAAAAARFRNGMPPNMMAPASYGQKPVCSPFANRQASCHLSQQDLFPKGRYIPPEADDCELDDDDLDALLRSTVENCSDEIPVGHSYSFPSYYPNAPPPGPFNSRPMPQRYASGHARQPKFFNPHMMPPPQQHPPSFHHSGSGFGYPGLAHPPPPPPCDAFNAMTLPPHIGRTLSLPPLSPHDMAAFAAAMDSPKRRGPQLVNPRLQPSPSGTPRASPANTPRSAPYGGGGSGAAAAAAAVGLLAQPSLGGGGGTPVSRLSAPAPQGGSPATGVAGTPSRLSHGLASPVDTPRMARLSFSNQLDHSTSSAISEADTDASALDSNNKASAHSGLDPSKTTLDMLGDLEPSLMPLLLQKARRKGKGGRSPALDPRLDPGVDPKKAKRILANRMSAAKSKLKQKIMMEGLRAKHEVLKKHKDNHQQELEDLRRLCSDLEAKNVALQAKVEVLDSSPPQAGAPSSSLPDPMSPSIGGLFGSADLLDDGAHGGINGGCSFYDNDDEEDQRDGHGGVGTGVLFSSLVSGVPDALHMMENVHVSDREYIRTSDGGAFDMALV